MPDMIYKQFKSYGKAFILNECYHSLPGSPVVVETSQRSLDKEFGQFQATCLTPKFKAS